MSNRSRPGVIVQILRGCAYSVVVIGLGAAVLGPLVFVPAREKARQSACASNLKQLSMAALAYAQDYDGRFPLRPRPGGDWVAWSWTTRPMHGGRNHLYAPSGGPVWDYAKNTCIAYCPSDPAHSRRDFKDHPHSSYVWNDALCGKTLKQAKDQRLVWDLAPFHSDGRNVAFINGHVQWLPAAAAR